MRTMAKRFIHYDIKNGVEYASIYSPQRIDGKKVNNPEYLGRVIDKENGIYKNRSMGVFRYNLTDGYTEIPSMYPVQEEKLILDFGACYAFYETLKKTAYYDIFQNLISDTDTLMAMIGYKVLESTSNRYAQDWWEGSYARILFPDSHLMSQRISDFLKCLGEEKVQRRFFEKYLAVTCPNEQNTGILVDSTGLPNDIHFPLTAVNKHGGKTSNEARLILVVDRHSDMPLFFRYNAGNIVDVTTLKSTIDELNQYGVKTEFAIVDAGYYSEKNIKELYSNKIAFLTRLIPNRVIYKELVAAHVDDLLQAKYMVMYRNRLLYIKRVEMNLFGHSGYAYIAIDSSRRNDEIYKYVKGAMEDGVAPKKMDEVIRSKGVFILISSESISTNEILKLYYTRQTVEQIFDINKNNLELLPLRTHCEETFRGHLMLTFMASVAYILINNKLKGSEYNSIGAFAALRNLKCKVFDDVILVKEPTKKMKDIAEILKIDFPSTI